MTSAPSVTPARPIATSRLGIESGFWPWNIQRLLLAIIILEIPIGIDVHLNQNYDAGDLGAIHGLNVSLTTVCVMGLLAYFLVRLAKDKKPSFRSILPLLIPPAIYLMAECVSLFSATSISLAVNQVWVVGQAFLILVCLTILVRTREDVYFVVAVLLAGLLIQSTVILGLAAWRQSIIVGPRAVAVYHATGRIGGTFASPNMASAYLALLLPLAVAMIGAKAPTKLRILAGVSLIAAVPALILTYSRGGWMAAAIAVSLLFLVALYRRQIRLKTFLLFVLVVLLFASVLWVKIGDRLFGDDEGAARSRLPLMRIAGRIIADHPVTGVGANNYALATRDYSSSGDFRGEWEEIVHNKYLLVWAETGTIGLIAFILFLGTTLAVGWKTIRQNNGVLALIVLALWVGIVGQLMHMTVDKFMGRSLVHMFWLMMAFLGSTCLVIRRTNQNVPRPVVGHNGPIVDREILS